VTADTIFRGSCYLRQKRDKWLVDWPATVGWNPTPLKTFMSTADAGQEGTFRVTAQIQDYYNFQYESARPTHYSVRLTDLTDEHVAGYVAKRSKEGKELYDLLRDAYAHEITVTVRRNAQNGNPTDNVDIVKVASKTWFMD
jgi:hypothetical protein